MRARMKRRSAHPMAEIRALVERQARSWERNDFALGAADWLPEGVLVAPGGTWGAAQLHQAMADFHASVTELAVEITNVFASPGGRKVAIEWDWIITRKADGVRSTMHDAIIVDLSHGKIKSWREYFDASGSVGALLPAP